MEYEVDFVLRLGPLAPLVATVLTPSLKADFTRSMQNLETLVLSGH